MLQCIWRPSCRLRVGLLALLLACGLSGCAELAYKAGDLYGVNCRPEKQVHGHCVASR
jgi:hypothetical protein